MHALAGRSLALRFLASLPSRPRLSASVLASAGTNARALMLMACRDYRVGGFAAWPFLSAPTVASYSSSASSATGSEGPNATSTTTPPSRVVSISKSVQVVEQNIAPPSSSVQPPPPSSPSVQPPPDTPLTVTAMNSSPLEIIRKRSSSLSFTGLGVPKTLALSLLRAGFKTPTDIQKAAIPIMMHQKSQHFVGMLALHSQSGSGKTLAYLVPLLAELRDALPAEPTDAPYVHKPSSAGSGNAHIAEPHILVITPSRELAVQVEAALLVMQRHMFRSVLPELFLANVSSMEPAEAVVYLQQVRPYVCITTAGKLLPLLPDLPPRIAQQILRREHILSWSHFKQKLSEQTRLRFYNLWNAKNIVIEEAPLLLSPLSMLRAPLTPSAKAAKRADILATEASRQQQKQQEEEEEDEEAALMEKGPFGRPATEDVDDELPLKSKRDLGKHTKELHVSDLAVYLFYLAKRVEQVLLRRAAKQARKGPSDPFEQTSRPFIVLPSANITETFLERMYDFQHFLGTLDLIRVVDAKVFFNFKLACLVGSAKTESAGSASGGTAQVVSAFFKSRPDLVASTAAAAMQATANPPAVPVSQSKVGTLSKLGEVTKSGKARSVLTDRLVDQVLPVAENVLHRYIVVPDNADKLSAVAEVCKKVAFPFALLVQDSSQPITETVEELKRQGVSAAAGYAHLCNSVTDRAYLLNSLANGEVKVVVMSQDMIAGLHFPLLSVVFSTSAAAVPHMYRIAAGRLSGVSPSKGTLITVLRKSELEGFARMAETLGVTLSGLKLSRLSALALRDQPKAAQAEGDARPRTTLRPA